MSCPCLYRVSSSRRFDARAPVVTWGTSPDQAVAVDQPIPDVIAKTLIEAGFEWRESSSGKRYGYPLGARHKRMVIEGMDTVDLTLDSLAAIQAFERVHFARHHWAQVM